MVTAFGLPADAALLGGDQTLSDNLIAMAMNGIPAGYFALVLRDDRKYADEVETWQEVRRLYRYLWVIYGLGLGVFGIQRILRYLFGNLAGGPVGLADESWLANGLALLLIGLPIWLLAWQTVQRSLEEAAERESRLRLAVLYLFVLLGAWAALMAGGVVLAVLLRLALGERLSFGDIMGEIGGPLSMGIPMSILWTYHAHHLKRTLASLNEDAPREGARRLYRTLFSLPGLGATFLGTAALLTSLIDLALNVTGWAAVRVDIAQALAAILIGLPLWLTSWKPLQAEAWPGEVRAPKEAQERGERARRSITRRGYLYLVLFVGVVGGMATATHVLFLLIQRALGEKPPDFTQDTLNTLSLLVLFAVLLTYHLWVLRRDGQLSARVLQARQERFPVLVIDPGEGTIGEQTAREIKRQAPQVPLSVRPIKEGIAPEEREMFKAVVLSEKTAVEPPEALRLWLREFEGFRLVVPGEAKEAEGWIWLRGGRPSFRRAAARLGRAVRQLAEEGETSGSGGTSPWLIVAYVLAALFTLQIALIVLGMFMEALD
ncbi:MAG: hypothetical protein D6770_10620 [Anaerolineae bacterium]|nr:MAG: hypothetical protein D6770_10620 [Anaerolineae bacterium]